MKARKGNRHNRSLAAAVLCVAFCNAAAAQGFSGGKNLHQLREALLLSGQGLNRADLPVFPNPQGIHGVPAVFRPAAMLFPGIQYGPSTPSTLPNPAFLPRWTADCLPFFCRIEHDFARKNRVPLKFRLGSVEYVDWLEGKSDFQALPPR